MIAFKLKSKEKFKFSPKTKIGIDLYLVGSKQSVASDFEIYQDPNLLFSDYIIQG